MNPFKIIEDAEQVIDNYAYKLKYSKNKVKDTNNINKLIKALNCLDGVLVSKYKTDAINTLIFALIYELMMFYKVYESELPIKDIFDTIKSDLFYVSELKKAQVVSILKQHELNNKIKNNSVFDKDYCNFEKMLDELALDLKKELIYR